MSSKGIRPLGVYRVLISRVLISCCLFFLCWRGWSGLLPHQLQQPVLTNFHYDLAMWVYKLSGLAYIVGQDPISSKIFTCTLFTTGILSFVFPLQRRFTVPFTLFFFLLSLNFNFFLTHNSHYLAGFVWMLFVLWPTKDEHFAALWDGLRYFACWIYGIAFVWKLVHGAFFQWDAGLLSARENMAGYLYQNPATITANLYYWMMDNPVTLNLGHKIVCLLEGAFIIGFFTKKFDKKLIVFMLLIHISTFLFADVFFLELMILALTFLPVGFWKKLWYRTVPKSVHFLQEDTM